MASLFEYTIANPATGENLAYRAGRRAGDRDSDGLPLGIHFHYAFAAVPAKPEHMRLRNGDSLYSPFEVTHAGSHVLTGWFRTARLESRILGGFDRGRPRHERTFGLTDRYRLAAAIHDEGFAAWLDEALRAYEKGALDDFPGVEFDAAGRCELYFEPAGEPPDGMDYVAFGELPAGFGAEVRPDGRVEWTLQESA